MSRHIHSYCPIECDRTVLLPVLRTARPHQAPARLRPRRRRLRPARRHRLLARRRPRLHHPPHRPLGASPGCIITPCACLSATRGELTARHHRQQVCSNIAKRGREADRLGELHVWSPFIVCSPPPPSPSPPPPSPPPPSPPSPPPPSPSPPPPPPPSPSPPAPPPCVPKSSPCLTGLSPPPPRPPPSPSPPHPPPTRRRSLLNHVVPPQGDCCSSLYCVPDNGSGWTCASTPATPAITAVTGFNTGGGAAALNFTFTESDNGATNLSEWCRGGD